MLRECDDVMSLNSSNDEWNAVNTHAPPVPTFRAQFEQQTGSETPARFTQDLTTLSRHPPTTAKTATLAGVSVQLSSSQWQTLHAGLRQRFEAVQSCIDAVVRKQSLPQYLKSSPFVASHLESTLAPVIGAPRLDAAWTWMGSTDLYAAADGELIVLDHNFSCASGLDILAGLMHRAAAPDSLSTERTVRSLFRSGSFFSVRAGSGSSDVAVLDPGFHSATFRANEFLARCLNAHIARSSDLSIRDGGVFLRAGNGEVRISTIVRRIDDELLDPNCYRPDSLVGLPGLVRLWKQGFVNVVSPPGSCVANSRSFGMLIPRMVRDFLGETPLLRSADVMECSDPNVLQTVLKDPQKYAIRTNDPQHPARPYFGDNEKSPEFAELLNRLKRRPSAYIARPLLSPRENSGVNLRVFASLDSGFRLLRAALARPCQPDGGAPQGVDSESELGIIV